jgi:hypothetical protein
MIPSLSLDGPGPMPGEPCPRRVNAGLRCGEAEAEAPPANLWVRHLDDPDQDLAAGRHPLRQVSHGTMGLWLPKLEAYGELKGMRFSPEDQLMNVSGATIDRLLRPSRKRWPKEGGPVRTKSGSELRSAIAVRRAGQEQ